MQGRLTRRHFLELVGRAGGSHAVYRAASALGLLPMAARAQKIGLHRLDGGKRRRVAILGAGIAGLTAAYELDRAGYDCVVLEAATRAGGRNMTLRAGDLVDEMDHPQRCEFDADPELYMNAGPARIPADHVRLLGYCRELGVRLEVFVNENRNAWLHDEHAFGGERVRNRRYVTDARGFIAELVAKSVTRADFDQPLDGVDVERVLEFARAFGDLDADNVYRGSLRAGAKSGGLVVPAVKYGTYDVADLLKAQFWNGPLQWGEREFQEAPMLQPVGGMDRVVAGFMGKVGHLVTFGARVLEVELKDDGVAIAYECEGHRQTLRADYCLDNIPMHILAETKNNFPGEYAAALKAVERGQLFKIGLQANRRFWEDEGIYGGISWTSQPITQIWYPSNGIFSSKGVIVGAYTFGDDGAVFEAMTPAERIESALEQGEKVHPGYRKHIDNGVSVVWHRMRHLLGCAAQWTPELMQRHFAKLQAPVGRHYLIGDQVSYHPGWQEGAIASAHHALEHLDARVSDESARKSHSA